MKGFCLTAIFNGLTRQKSYLKVIRNLFLRHLFKEFNTFGQDMKTFGMSHKVMMGGKKVVLGLAFAMFSFLIATHVEAKTPSFITLCYHDIVPVLDEHAFVDAAPVPRSELKEHFDWLRDNGYTVVSLKDILKAKQNKTDLPPKSVLLTFDDGYRSFYEIVYPMLQSYGYTAVLALETSWLDTPENAWVDYGGRKLLPRSFFLSWDQIREMADSQTVELASHSHDLHKGHPGNPQKIMLPAGAHRLYDPKTNSYESVSKFKKRVGQDLRHSARIIYKNTGHQPKMVMWPYGRYNHVGVQAAMEAGYELTASLAFFADWPTIPRLMIHKGFNLPEMMHKVEVGAMAGSTAYSRRNPEARLPNSLESAIPPQRVMHVDIDMIYDEDPKQLNRNIALLLDRVKAAGINVVYLQAYADPDGNGTTDALYFPNRHLPMRADLFNYLSWQLAILYKCEVYAWLPVLGFDIPNRPVIESVSADKTGSVYTRLTPFDDGNKRIIKEIYQDLASHAYFAGIIFHDDAIMGDYEDVSPAGKAWMRSLGLPDDPEVIRKDGKMMHTFSRAKSRALIDFTKELQAAVETWHPPVYTARNMYAPPILTPQAEEWMAQNLDDFLTTYDFTGLEAMPFMEGAADWHEKWMEELILKVAQHPLGLRKTVFELQAKDWRPDNLRPMPNEIMAQQMQQLLKHGAVNFGYYPDDPILGHPDMSVIYPYFSIQSNP